MKRFAKILPLVLCLSVLAIALSVPTSSQADGPATTAAATSKTSATVIPANDGQWHTVLTTTIKNPTADDDLFIDVSQVTRVTTLDVTSSATPGAISSGDARLLMRVLVDGVVAEPGQIVFDEQLMALTSNLGRFLSLSCTETATPQTIVTTSCVCVGPSPLPAISCAPAAGFVPSQLHRTILHTPNDHRYRCGNDLCSCARRE